MRDIQARKLNPSSFSLMVPGVPDQTYRVTKDKRSQVYFYSLPQLTVGFTHLGSEGRLASHVLPDEGVEGCQRSQLGEVDIEISFIFSALLFDIRVDVPSFLTTLGVTSSQIFRSSPFWTQTSQTLSLCPQLRPSCVYPQKLLMPPQPTCHLNNSECRGFFWTAYCFVFDKI